MTNAHLSGERLSELACGRAETPVNGEKAHLEACAACRARLADERLLSALLAKVPVRPPATAFAARAVERYRREIRAIAVRRALVALAAIAVSAGLWLLVAWAGSEAIALDLAGTVAAAAAVLRALGAVVAASPLGSAVIVALLATSLIAASGALAALLREPRTTRAPIEARVKEV
jgi:hypothetical protein